MPKTLEKVAYEAFGDQLVKTHWWGPDDCNWDKEHTGFQSAWEATAKAVRSKVIEECIQVVADGVKWFPEDAFSKTHITASNETARLLAKALTALKDQSNDPT